MNRKIFYFFLLLVLTGCGAPVDSNQDYDRKIKKAQKALERDYNNPKTHTYLGVLYEKRGLSSQAEKHYRIAIELDPRFAEALMNLGNLYFKERDLAGAIQTLQKAVESNPEDLKIHYLLATVYKEDRQYQQALTHYKKVLELDSKHVLAQNFVGVISYELKEFDEAEKAFNRALALDTNFADAYGNLGILYDFNLHDREKAVRYYEKFLELKSEGENVTLVHDLLSKAKVELEKARRVEEEAKKKQEEAQSAPEVPGESKTLLVPKPEPIQAAPTPPKSETPAEIVVVKTPVSVPRETNVSGASATQPVPDARTQSLSHFNRGATYQSKGQHPQAISEYRKSLELNPSNVKAHFNLGILYKWKGDYEGAIREYKEVIRLDPSFAKAYYNLGIVLKTLGRNGEAIAEFKKAIQKDPRYSDAYLGLGLLYSQKKEDLKLAVAFYKRYLELSPSGPAAVKIRTWLHSVGEDG